MLPSCCSYNSPIRPSIPPALPMMMMVLLSTTNTRRGTDWDESIGKRIRIMCGGCKVCLRFHCPFVTSSFFLPSFGLARNANYLLLLIIAPLHADNEIHHHPVNYGSSRWRWEWLVGGRRRKRGWFLPHMCSSSDRLFLFNVTDQNTKNQRNAGKGISCSKRQMRVLQSLRGCATDDTNKTVQIQSLL